MPAADPVTRACTFLAIIYCICVQNTCLELCLFLCVCVCPCFSFARALRITVEDGDADDRSLSVPRSLPAGPRRPGHLPFRLFLLMSTLQGMFAMLPEPFFLVDAFSGKGAISWGFKQRNRRYTRMDIALDSRDDPRSNSSCVCTITCA